jgi:hypothetical protein
MCEEIRRHFELHGIVALAFPPIMIPPPLIGEEAEVAIRGQDVPLNVAMARNTSLGSCTSMASLILPAGMTSNGLPVGLEFDALMGNDRAVLALGLSLEEVLGPIPAPGADAGDSLPRIVAQRAAQPADPIRLAGGSTAAARKAPRRRRRTARASKVPAPIRQP